jgi:RimJ/RimL family protein N-acetyltransferase
MDDGIEIIAGAPEAFSSTDRARFRELVIEAGEVVGAALSTNITNARALVILRHDRIVRGVAALKRPQASYRKKISELSGVPLPADTYPFELGYVFIEPEMQGRRLSHRLIAEALSHGEGMAIFATVRTDNAAMRVALSKAGFKAKGQAYPGREKRMIELHVKQPSEY